MLNGNSETNSFGCPANSPQPIENRKGRSDRIQTYGHIDMRKEKLKIAISAIPNHSLCFEMLNTIVVWVYLLQGQVVTAQKSAPYCEVSCRLGAHFTPAQPSLQSRATAGRPREGKLHPAL